MAIDNLFIWLWLVVNDRKSPAGTIFLSHTNQPVVLLHEPATKRTSQPNKLREHMGRCQSLARKRRLNRVFEAMGLCYADWSGPSTSLPADDAIPHGRGCRAQGQRGRKVMAGPGMNTAAMESRKRKLSDQGRGPTEPADVRIGREIAGKVGNSKKVMIG